MNLTKLFEMQRELDERIVKEKGLENEYLLPQKILALQVELGECANEWRGFKFWSKNQKKRTVEVSLKSEFKGRKVIEGFTESGIRRLILDDKEVPFNQLDDYYEIKNPLLEEYIDCLHFILSIGLELGVEINPCDGVVEVYEFDGIANQFITLMQIVDPLMEQGDWNEAFGLFYGLGNLLGFTWEQIEEAYMAKNAVNHNRQSTGY